MYFEPVEFLIRIFIVAVVVGVVLFFFGRAYEWSRNKGRRDELKRLRNWKGSTEGLYDKLKNEARRRGDPGPYYEIDNRGNPKNA